MLDKQRGDRIKQAMKERDITRDGMALSSGYSTGTISAFRNGNDFSTEQLAVLCELLDVSPNLIMDGADYPFEVSMIASELHQLNNPSLNSAILELIRTFKKT